MALLKALAADLHGQLGTAGQSRPIMTEIGKDLLDQISGGSDDFLQHSSFWQSYSMFNQVIGGDGYSPW
jgi:hypothetical protein